MKRRLHTLPILALALAACTATSPAATEIALPNGESECVAHTHQTTTIYSRPSAEADVFAEVGSGISQPLTARTEDGWLGFDPGVAQAANLGSFRLRWLWYGDVRLGGACAQLPVVWAPQAGYCYDMPMDSVLVHAQPNAASSVLTTLEAGQFAAVMGLSDSGWAEIDLELGNTGLVGTGWVDAQTLNLNGSACSQLPRLP